MYELIQGDCIEVMKRMEAGSVQCCVTSPPYFGLRDYGTAAWEGGDPACDHSEARGTTRGGPHSTLSGGQDTTPHKMLYRDLCGKCGARRIDQQVGLEETPEAYVAKLVDVFWEVRRLLRDDGTCWINLGDSYVGSANTGGSGPRGDGGVPYRISGLQPKKGEGLKPKDLIGIPWLVAFALRSDGWYLRSEIIWHKKAPMPESVTDRPTKAHEQLFLLAKSPKYFYDADAIAEPTSRLTDWAYPQPDKAAHAGQTTNGTGATTLRVKPADGKRNKRSVWTLGPESYSGAHFATMPTKLVEPCILAGSKPGDLVLDPFNGSGTTGAVSLKHGRRYIGIDLNPDYLELAHTRITQAQPMLLGVL